MFIEANEAKFILGQTDQVLDYTYANKPNEESDVISNKSQVPAGRVKVTRSVRK